jgi:uncharacterized protein (DUF433 family)
MMPPVVTDPQVGGGILCVAEHGIGPIDVALVDPITLASAHIH